MGGYEVGILDEMGQPADVIAEVATKLAADLIVMVTHGRRGLARLVEGKISLPGPGRPSFAINCRR
jgi:nucleotide-binding universal stress UspA family protein